MVVCNSNLFFSAATAAEGRELWMYDGTNPAAMVKDIAAGVTVGSDVKNLACLGTILFFSAEDGINGAELGKRDGTLTGTTIVTDVNAGAGSSNPEYLTVYGSYVYFAAETIVGGVELWKADATGATLVSDIRIGSGGSYPSYLTVFTSNALAASSKLFFLATDGKRVGNMRSASGDTTESQGMQLWVYDGTTVSRAFDQTFANFDVDVESMDADFPADFGVFQGTLYYSANFGNRDYIAPAGSVGRDITSWHRVHGHDQAFVLWDDDVALDSGHLYGVQLEVEKGELQVVGSGLARGASVSFNGTLKEVNDLATNVLYYPTDGESGWAQFKVTVRDTVNDAYCQGLIGAECKEETIVDTRMIWITAVNDAPVLSWGGGAAALSTAVDAELDLVGFTVTDDDIKADGMMTVEIAATKGRVRVNGRDGLAFDGAGQRGLGEEKEVKFYANIGDVNEALKVLVFECRGAEDRCATGDVVQLLVKVGDGGGSGKGGVLTDETVVQINLV